MITTHAVAKLIIAGEHAVVYRRPAIAVPVPAIRAQIQIVTAPHGQGCIIHSPDLARSGQLGIDSDPLLDLVSDLLTKWHFPIPDIAITITSAIPIASGMGSGAAVATALVRAMAQFLHHDIDSDEVGALVYRSEQRLHGTPSGIDNTVIAYDQPISFCRRPPHPDGTPQPALIAPLTITHPITLVVGDSGERSPTHLAVAGVRQRRDNDTAHYDALFDAIAAVTIAAQQALASGDTPLLGALCTQNHSLLQAIGVSTPLLNQLVAAAITAGAYGAKLSGAGVGGVMFAVTDATHSAHVAAALQQAGATRTFTTVIAPYLPV
jgi:mevalonate kinase